MGSPSESEGEIVETMELEEKATTRPKKAPETSIDLPYSTASSTASTPRQSVEPTMFGYDGAYDDDRTHGNRTRRANSPNRHLRGEKRHRRDSESKQSNGHANESRDRYDERRHKVHVENNRRFEDDRRRPVSYADIDRPYPTSRRDDRRRDDRYNDRNSRDRSRERKSRDRSRSPYRHPRTGETGRDSRDEQKGRTGRDEGLGKGQSDHREYSHSSRPTGHSGQHPRSKEIREHATNHRNDMSTRFKPESTLRGGGDRPLAKSSQMGKSGLNDRRDSRQRNPRAGVFDDKYEWMTTGSEPRPPAKEELDYDALLEQKQPDPEAEAEAEVERRRKAREAMKKRLAAQTTGIESGPPTPRTPDIELPAATTPRSTSPDVSKMKISQKSAPGSPSHLKTVSNLDEAVDGATKSPVSIDDTEEPSAADYDPTNDEQENRALHEEQRTRSSPVPVETNRQEQVDAVMAEVGQKAEDADDDDGDDMFAVESDEDDDMFSTKPPRAGSKTGAKAAGPNQAGRKLHKGMLDTWDDPEGYYKIIAGELFDDRYVLGEVLGRGVFANVVRATDNKTGKLVAIKIIRNNDSMKKAGMKEIEMLLKLSENDPEDQKHIVRLLRHFDHKDHLCMVFENLGKNLRGVIKFYGRNLGMPLTVVKSYAMQMFKALSLLKKCNILHADLKPDNVLADAGGGTKIKIADLGSAADASEKDITPYLVSRFYRAPEIMLGIAPEYAIDMWSIGCTLFELFTDKILFQGVSNNQMLKSIMECRGKISKKVLRRGELRFHHFDEHLEQFYSLEKAGNPLKDTIRAMTINSQPVAGKDIKSRLWKAAKAKGTFDAENYKELELFKDLLDKCLKLDPEERITPNQALMHPFFRPGLTK